MSRTNELIFENDFPTGSNMTGETLKGPNAAERMNYEFFTRLAIHAHSQASI